MTYAGYFESEENRQPFIDTFGSTVTRESDSSTFEGIVEREYSQDNDRPTFNTRWQIRAATDDLEDIEPQDILVHDGNRFRVTTPAIPDDAIGWSKIRMTQIIP